jgi:cell division transport system permease protein
MRALEYSLRQGLTSVWRHRGSSLLAVVAIALALVVLGAVLLGNWNVQRWLASRAAAAELSVYLDDGATAEARGAIEQTLDASGVVASRTYVSKSDARAAFRAAVGELGAIVEALDDNPFPASIDAKVKPEAGAALAAGGLLSRLATLPGVADVRYDREWLARVERTMASLRTFGAVVGILMAMAAAVTVATVVRLGLYARREELEIMTLVGSPLTFIRGPFVAEGVIEGGLGALLSLLLLWTGYMVVARSGGAGLEGMIDVGTLTFLPPMTALGLVAGGMLVGALGGLAASRHAL